jgi:hypothetical protein
LAKEVAIAKKLTFFKKYLVINIIYGILKWEWKEEHVVTEHKSSVSQEERTARTSRKLRDKKK